MTTEQTAQQLELAAQILWTGHPWEYNHDKDFWQKASGTSVLLAIAEGWPIRPILAIPPDNRPIHNPDNLTAEQVGVGYRLLCAEDGVPSGKVDTWMFGGWCSAYVVDKEHLYECDKTYRLPLSVPWPEAKPDSYAELKKAHAEGKVIQWHDGIEWIDHILPHYNNPIWMHPVKDYRIKPDSTFQLPPPPPGMQWHRADGWQEGDLPQGMRPYVQGETLQKGDEWRQYIDKKWQVVDLEDTGIGREPDTSHPFRTTRPLTFTHAGKTWTWHRPGDPMPCDAGRRIECVFADHTLWHNNFLYGKGVRWTKNNELGDILGWRYADEKKTVPLGPEDVPPFSILRLKGFGDPWNWMPIESVDPCFGIRVISKEVSTSHEWIGWGNLKEYEINRSIPLTGKWNPDAWEPCQKQIDA